MTRSQRFLLYAALLVAFVARAPGVLWGYNFPGGWYGHHVDEYVHAQLTQKILYPAQSLAWEHPYPKGMAAHAAVPLKLKQALLKEPQPKSSDRPPEPAKRADFLLAGRLWSVLYGTLGVLATFLLARALLGDARVALLSAWILALGGLHVTQSHFFLADAASSFWILLGSLLLWRSLEDEDARTQHFLVASAFCFGAAVGLKMAVITLPSLGLAAILRRPRIGRTVYAAVFFFTGLMAVNLTFYTLRDLAQTVMSGTNDPYLRSAWDNLQLYLIEMPSMVSLPVFLFALGGTAALLRKFWMHTDRRRQMNISLVFLLPLALQVFFLLFKLDHFPRHVFSLLPWMAIAAAWGVWRTAEWLQAKGLAPAFLLVPLFVYLGLFVYDGERMFLREPRNAAAHWLLENVPAGSSYYWRNHTDIPGYKHVAFHDGSGRPQVLVMEMYRVNPVLSGMGWRNSFPRDYRYIFEARNQEYVDRIQDLFRGNTEYREVARFTEGYFMPEFVFTDRLIGNRSRNYLTELVIFRRTETEADRLAAAPPPAPPGIKDASTK